MDDPKKTTRLGHSQRDMEAVHITGLADVTGADKPFDIVVEGRPPKSVTDVGSGRECTLMAGVVMPRNINNRKPRRA
jgi:hypothetical protein